ncbi:coiled-coil domain-containing protein 60-like [Pelodytes ibericus]
MPGDTGLIDPRSFVVLKPLSIPNQKGIKIQSRSTDHYSCWEPSSDDVFKENYQRRHKQLTQQGYNSVNYQPYKDLGHPLILEAKKLILHSLGQDEKQTKTEEFVYEKEIQEETNDNISCKIPGPKSSSSSVTSQYLKHRKKDAGCFNREMNHTRELLCNVKYGRGYFNLLHKEEEAKRLAQQEKQEELKYEPQPIRDSSGESSGDEGKMRKQTDKTRLFITEVAERKKGGKRAIRRPFTPIHNSLFGTDKLNEHPESLFRQLCALYWLLESLTLEPACAMRSVTACWSMRDPGGCKTSLKRINREKEVEAKWEQFIMPEKSKKQNQKIGRSYLQQSRKSSFLSTSLVSGLSSVPTPMMSSVSSLIPSSDAGGTISSEAIQEAGEDFESTANSSLHNQGKLSKEEDEEPLSDYLQGLIEMIAESVRKELDDEESHKKHSPIRNQYDADIKEAFISEERDNTKPLTQRPISSPTTCCSAISLFVKKKLSSFRKLRDKFFKVADEADVHFHDKVEAIERRRHEYNLQKYRSLDTVSHFHQDLKRMRKPYHHVKEEKDYTDTSNWFVVLLSRISPAMKKNQKIQKILSMLEKLEEKLFVRIRPNAFLKMLSGLRNWELCAPDISVAIEFVREHVIQMPLEDYTFWLQTRLTSSPPNRVQTAPPIR